MEDVLRYTKKQEAEEALEGAGTVPDPAQGLVQDLDHEEEDPGLDRIQEVALNPDQTPESAPSLDLLGTLEETDLGLDQHQDPKKIERRMEIDLHLEKEMHPDLVLALVLVPDLDQEVTKYGNGTTNNVNWLLLNINIIFVPLHFKL